MCYKRFLALTRGGSHGLVAKALQLFAETDGPTLLQSGHTTLFTAATGR